MNSCLILPYVFQSVYIEYPHLLSQINHSIFLVIWVTMHVLYNKNKNKVKC